MRNGPIFHSRAIACKVEIAAMEYDRSLIDTLALLIGKVVLTITAVYFVGWFISQIFEEEKSVEEFT